MLGLPRIQLIKPPAVHQRNSHGGEISWASGEFACNVARLRLPVDRKVTLDATSTKWQSESDRAGGADAGNAFDAVQERIVKGNHLCACLVFRLGQLQIQNGNVVRVESRIDLKQAQKALHEQSSRK